MAQGGAVVIANIISWLTTSSHWQGPDGIPIRIWEHLRYSLIAVAIALIIALPLGVLIGHTRRGTFLVTAANAIRALPTLGLLIYFVVLISPHIHGKGDAAYLIPTEIVLVVLAIPSILSNTYAGIQSVEPEVRDAARGMGMMGRQVAFQVELPNALPLIISGIRSAMLQVIATATIAAYVSLGGLGRFIIDGQSQHDYTQMASGAVLVALLALVIDLVLAFVQRYAVSPGVSGRLSRKSVLMGNAPPQAVTASTASG